MALISNLKAAFEQDFQDFQDFQDYRIRSITVSLYPTITTLPDFNGNFAELSSQISGIILQILLAFQTITRCKETVREPKL